MNRFRHHPSRLWRPAFSLIELLAVIAIMGVLLSVGVGVMGSSTNQARRTAADSVTAMIEQARTTAITSRSMVVLAIAEPGDLPAGDDRVRLGLFKVAKWPSGATTVDAVLLKRWQALPTGAIPLGGDVNGIRNPYDLPELTVRYQSAGQTTEVVVHAIGFTPRGGMLWPTGSDPVVMRIAEGGYRGGKAVPNRRGGTSQVSEDRIQIGRVVARPWRIE